jgi:hypothetical protein
MFLKFVGYKTLTLKGSVDKMIKKGIIGIKAVKAALFNICLSKNVMNSSWF